MGDAISMNGEKVEFDIPAGVLKICKTLNLNGEEGFLVGGSLRDLLLGHPPDDWDLATTATPEKIIKLFNRVVPTGIAHGTVTVLFGKESYEVTTLRSEQGYSDGRHPDSVKFVTNIGEDLSRRDFTVNAIAWNPITHALYDPFNGREDLEKRCLRAVGDAMERFEEDGLRIMRAARFAATLQFCIDGDTLAALSKKAPQLQKVSVERKRDELQKMLGAERPSFGLRVLAENHIWDHLCGAIARVVQSAHWLAVESRVDAVPSELNLRMAALFLDVSPGDVFSWMDAYLVDKRTKKRVQKLISLFPFAYSPSWSDAEVRTYVSKMGISVLTDFIVLLQAQVSVGQLVPEQLAEFTQRLELLDITNCALSVRELAVSGGDVMDFLGIPPGPKIGDLLDGLLRYVLEHPEKNRREALLAYAREIECE